MRPPHMLWVDPGKMTGLAYLNQDGGFGAREFPFWPACKEIEVLAARHTVELAIGWERFDINADTHKKTREGITDALHMIGVCRFLTARYSLRFLGEAQQHTPDADEKRQLITLGWWRPGMDDAQSAACHMLRWLARTQNLTPAQREVVYSQ